jgi:two-component system, OmpR family, sensor histidine kinase MprB
VLAIVALVTVASAAIGIATYRSTAGRLLDEVDGSLASAVAYSGRPGGWRPPGGDRPGPDRDDLRQYGGITVQFSDRDGSVLWPSSIGELPPVQTNGRQRFVTTTVDGERYRVLAAPVDDGTVQVARSLAETDRVLASVRNRTVVALAIVGALAAIAGWLIAGQLTRRLSHLTAAAEHVAVTGEFDVPVPSGGKDEAGRLGTAFDRMLGALASSRASQQRLVQDAGHELRTPLTSLRTNVSVLRRIDELPAEDRARLIEDLESETRELSTLVNEVIALATDRRDEEPPGPVDLRVLAERCAERAERRSGAAVKVDGATSAIVTGRAGALERAIGNLVENAVKFTNGSGEPVEVVVSVGAVEVRDRGPGIPTADLPHVFERFYRSIGARSTPGSGLGLSIVADVAASHGGSAFARARDGGGAIVGFTVALVPPVTS